MLDGILGVLSVGAFSPLTKRCVSVVDQSEEALGSFSSFTIARERERSETGGFWGSSVLSMFE